MRLLVLTFIFLFCGVSLVLAGESCPFLTNDDVERVTGRKLLFELTSMQLPGGEGTLCDSDIARVVVFSGENSEREYVGTVWPRFSGEDPGFGLQ
jgi:hypothetical protein